MRKEITSLVNSEAIERNCCYFSTLNDIVACFATHRLACRGEIDAFESKDERGNELFLGPFNYTVEKDQRLRAIIKIIPRNATYTSPDMQNELIAAMSSVVTEGIRHEIENSRYTIKVDGTKDPTGVENISTIIRFFNEHFLKVAEHLLVLSSTDWGDAKAITGVILAELIEAGLTSSKILSQVRNGASGIKCINFPMWGNLCTCPPCTLPSSVHCPVHLHTRPAPSVYTAFLLMPCQLRFEPATMVSVLMFLRINLITNWGKFCTCSRICNGRTLRRSSTSITET